MKKKFSLIAFFLITLITANAQRVSTQEFMVRKITYSTKDQIVPISGANVMISNAQYRSNSQGKFTANIPETADKGFRLTSVSATGYILSIPENLSKKLYLSKNPIVIVMADVSAVKKERERIEANNRSALMNQERLLKEQVRRNEKLVKLLKKSDSNYKQAVEDLKRANEQIESFVNGKAAMQAKIDSLAERLSLQDIQSQAPDDQIRIEKEKNGEWLEVITDEVVSRIDERLEQYRDKRLNEISTKLDEIADEYYNLCIRENNTLSVGMFIDNYSKYVSEVLESRLSSSSSKLLDMMVDNEINEDARELESDKIFQKKRLWKTEKITILNTAEDDTVSVYSNCLEEVKQRFLAKVLYPERETQRMGIHRQMRDYMPLYEGFTETLKKAFPDYYSKCESVVTDKLKSYLDLSDENFLNQFNHVWRYEVDKCIEKSGIADKYKMTKLFADWISISISANIMNRKVEHYNESLQSRIDSIDAVNKESLAHNEPGILSKLGPLKVNDNLKDDGEVWKLEEREESAAANLEQLKADNETFFNFLYPLVLKFFTPIKDKYDCKEALSVFQRDFDDDILYNCLRKFHDNKNNLVYYRGAYLPFLDEQKASAYGDIIDAIVFSLKSFLVKSHNAMIEEIKNSKINKEKSKVANLNHNIMSFNSDKSVFDYLATHIFYNDDFEISSWYNSDVTEWHLSFPNIKDTYEKIAMTVVSRDSKNAKLKMKIQRSESAGVPVIVTVRLNGSKSVYTESCGGETRTFTVKNK